MVRIVMLNRNPMCPIGKDILRYHLEREATPSSQVIIIPREVRFNALALVEGHYPAFVYIPKNDMYT